MRSAAITSKRLRVLTFLNMALGVLLLLSILFLSRSIFTMAFVKTSAITPMQRTAPADVRKKSLQDYEIILKNSPFGLPPATLRPLSSFQERASQRSDLVLIGTVAGIRRNSFAIFSDGSGRQELYRVGETIPGAGKLQRVEKDKVVIKGDGGVADIPIADIVKITEVRTSQAGTQPASFVRSIGEGAFLLDQKKVQQAVENPNQLMTDARLQPNVIEGKQEGFILREVKTGGIYQSLGLQNGDVLLRINDYTISNPENALQAFTALRGMERIQLDIVRNGAKTTLTYQIR